MSWPAPDPGAAHHPPYVHFPRPVPLRKDVLEEAVSLITGDRNAQYGEPTADFQRTADLWNTYLHGVASTGRTDILPHDVAVAQILLKISRLVWSPSKRDHWVDIAGYAGCGAECALGGVHGLDEADR